MVTKPPPPISLPHQDIGTKFLRDRTSAALFDEQGLGKSKQLIDALNADVAEGNLAGALIVCPNGLKSNWAGELERFSTLRYAVFGSGKSARRLTFQSLQASFYVINYEAIASELPSLKALLKFKRMALVLDESHRIKTPDAKTTQAVLKLREFAARRYLLSGTPVANKPEDLWSQLLFLDDGHSVGTTFEDFQARFRAPAGGYQKIDELRDAVAAQSLRRTKEHAVDLPSKTYIREAVTLSGRQLVMYEKMRRELELWVLSLAGEEVITSAESILARMVRLAQIASNPYLIDKGYTEIPAKVVVLDRLLDDYMGFDATRKVIVWTSFVENIPLLTDRYKAYRPVTIHGAVSNTERDHAVSAFRTDANTRLMIANPAAAREGLTLTEANVAIYMDRTFNLVDYLQSQDRIHRISQTRDCDIVLLIGSGTIDEFIDFSLEQKHRLARYAQLDVDAVAIEDLLLEKPEVLRALLAPRPFSTAA